MHHFSYRHGELHAEDVPFARIAAEVGTPVYVYSTATLERHYQAFAAAFKGQKAHVFYAMKANSNLGRPADAGGAGRGCRYGVGGRDPQGAGGGHSRRRSCSPASARSRPRWRSPSMPGSIRSTSRPKSELHALSRIARAPRASARPPYSASIRMSAPADTPRSPRARRRTSSASASAKRSGSTMSRPIWPACAWSGLAVHIGSQIRELGELEAAFKRMRELRDAARPRPQRRAARSRRRPRHPL